AVALDRHPHLRGIAKHHPPDGLRVESLAHAGRADEVAEDDRDDLAVLSRLLRLPLERDAAAGAEARSLGVLLAAARAVKHHVISLDGWHRLETDHGAHHGR